MQLLRIHYKGKTPRTILLLLLARDDDYVVGLDCQNVTGVDRKAILSSPTVSLSWIKKNCPNSYRAAFRKLRTVNCNILETYEVGQNA